MAATIDRDQLLAEARRTWQAYINSGTEKDYAAAREATRAAQKAGINLAEIRDQ